MRQQYLTQSDSTWPRLQNVLPEPRPIDFHISSQLKTAAPIIPPYRPFFYSNCINKEFSIDASAFVKMYYYV